MAIIERSSNDGYDLTNALTWVGSVPTASDVAKWGSSANVGNTAIIATSKQFGAVWISTSGTSTVNGGGSWGSSQITGAGVPNDRSLYIEANRILTGAANYAFLGGTAGAIRNHDVEILSGGELQVNGRIIGALSGSGYNRVTKYGAGTMWFGRSGTNMGTIGITSLTIREGTVKVGGAAGTDPIGTGTITFNATAGNTPTLAFEFYSTASRTISNAISVSNSGTIQANSGMTGTLTGGASGAGTLTIGAGGGTLNFNSAISCPLNMVGTLTMSGTNSISGSTITGSGTINMNGGTISSDAPTFSGTVNGTFNYGLAATSRTLAGSVSGAVSIPAYAIVTFKNASNAGYISNIGDTGTLSGANAYVEGVFNGNPGGWMNIVRGSNLYFVGAAAGFNPARQFSLWGGAAIRLTAGATCASSLFIDYQVTTDGSTIVADDATTCYLTSTSWAITDGGAPATISPIYFGAKQGGVLVISGAPVNNTGTSRPFNINGSGAAYTGIVRLTGSLNGTAKVAVTRGILHLNSASSVGGAGGIDVSANATLACSSTNPTYAAQITGNVSLAANSILRFGAPA